MRSFVCLSLLTFACAGSAAAGSSGSAPSAASLLDGLRSLERLGAASQSGDPDAMQARYDAARLLERDSGVGLRLVPARRFSKRWGARRRGTSQRPKATTG